MRRFVVLATLVCLAFVVSAFSQGGNAQLGGIVTDPSGALMPGVTITVLNTDTGVSNSAVTNESGAYNFPSLLPGRAYRVTATLPGFQTKSITNLELGTAVTARQDFELGIASQSTTVEVSIEANSLITAAGASIGEVLSEQRVREMPIVGNDVLSLINIMPGVVGENFAGLPATSINTVRDGLSVSDGRFSSAGVFGTTVINPDLVGEIRLILAPVDAEVGRGNGQVQIQTRSGTNRFTGALVWNVRNSGLNPNTWGNNNDIDATTGLWSPTVPNWYNQHQFTGSVGGPVIRNKTFFFALWDQQLDYRRDLVSANVMTETAKQGIFRFFEGWNPGNAQTALTSTGNNPTAAAVDFQGNPVAPPGLPMSALRCISVFGNIKTDGSPFTQADCPGGTAIIQSGPWDSNRAALDSTGYIRRILDAMPTANYFASGDGLNQAQFRYTRGRNGVSGGNATIGNDQNQNRKQLNIKIDHNFNQNHKVSFNWSTERNNVFNDTPNWPGGISYKTFRNPDVLTLNGTSTLTPTLLNEARFGMRRQNAGVNAPWEDQYGDSEVINDARSLMIAGSNGYTALVSPGAGAYSFGGNANGIMNTAPGQYNGNTSPLYNYADTVSWTHGKHAFKFGGEARYTLTNGYNNIPQIPFPRVTGGAGGMNSPLSTASTLLADTVMRGNSRTNAANMLYFLAGSVGNASMLYWIDDASDVTNGHWEDTLTVGRKSRDLKENEYAFFAKDDWKLTKNLTLNLGLRWEYFGPPFFGSGFTTTSVDQGYGLFGTNRTSDDPFSNWLQPGGVFLTGYGNTPAANALRCVSGVTQSANLPVSTCDPSRLSIIEFVGPNTPNPDKSVVRQDRNNFGPAIGFAYQLPFWGEGKTTIRGGYQVTYGGSGRNNGGGAANSTEVVLGSAPGALSTANTNLTEFSGQYLDLRSIPALVPVRPSNPALPGGSIDIFNRNVAFSAYDPNFVTPYTQNFTLSATRTVRRNVTVDFRYIGTVSKKSEGFLNSNLNDVYFNKELMDALTITRAGGDAPLFDQMLAGLNLNSNVTGYGPVGTVVNGVLQTGSAHLRRNATFSGNIANGDFSAVAASLNGNGSNLPTVGAAGGFQTAPISAVSSVGGRLLRNGCDRIANGLVAIGPGNAASARCFPENYIVANSQLGTTTYITNSGSSNYHSLQSQVTLRPTYGFTIQATHTWSKNLSQPGSGYTNPLDRRADYTYAGSHRTHDFRTNGSFELPIGPNKLLFGNSSGWVARLIERWQTSFILNMSTGARETIDATGGLYANSVPDVVGPFSLSKGEVTWGYPTTNPAVSDGRYFGTQFVKVPDPQCAAVSAGDTMGFNLQANCTIDAVADAQTGQILLQNPKPGTRGNLGRQTFTIPGTYTFDANASKTFRLAESKSVQLRFDATNVLNHPTTGGVTTSINSGNALGQITAKGNNTRSFQGQVRITF